MRSIRNQAEIRANFGGLLQDESRFTLGVPQRLYFPADTEDLMTVVRESAADGVPLTAIGGQTGITGGSTPPENCYAVVFSAFNSLKRLERLAADRFLLYCEPGVTLTEIAAFLAAPLQWPVPVPGAAELPRERNWFYPPDPTEMSAQLGGTVATNASGARSYYYGATRAHIASLGLVLATGDTVTLRRARPGERGLRAEDGYFTLKTDQGRSLVFREPAYQSKSFKNASGYFAHPQMELIDLLIGSEGTLALF
jgi:D-lactate dehydrogenase (cytochrome)